MTASDIVYPWRRDPAYGGMTDAAAEQSWKARTIERPRDDKGISTVTASELRGKQFPAIRYVLPGYIPEGLTLFVSRPKLGKSWLVLDLCIAITAGRMTLGELQPTQGEVLYLALEDGERRLQRRMRRLLPDADWPERLTFATEWPRANEGGVAKIERWISEASAPALVVIDTLQKFRKPQIANKNGYGVDYDDIGELQKLASKYSIAVIVVHHDRKAEADDPFDTISGTLGLSGAADTMAILKRTGQGVTLHIRGRDIEDTETAVQFLKDSCRWTMLGNASDVYRTKERSRVIQALQEYPQGAKVTDIMISANIATRGAADMLLHRMMQEGEIVKVARGVYALPSETTPIDELDR